MEKKEFNSVEEAIAALNGVRNIDYSGIENVDEISERDFYNNLMNNFRGTKNIRFTAEQRRNYQEALRRKGLPTYAKWKQMQPTRNEKVTWKDSVEKGSLDVPVNLFSKLIEAEDERKFEYIKDVATNDEKSDIGKKWLENSTNRLKELLVKGRGFDDRTMPMNGDTRVMYNNNQNTKNKPKSIEPIVFNNDRRNSRNTMSQNNRQKFRDDAIVNDIMDQSEKDLSDFVSNILEERKAQGRAQKNPQPARKRGITRKQEFDNFFTERHRKFNSHDEVVDALNSIQKINFDNEPDKETQQKFYYDIMRTLMEASDLEIPDGGEGSDIAFKYRQALGNIGCKTMKELKASGAMNRSTKRPAKVIDSILNSRRHDNNKGFRVANSKIRDDDRLRDWVDDTKVALIEQDERRREKFERRESKRERERYPVPVEKKSRFSFKKAFARAGIATLAFFGVATTAVGAMGGKGNSQNDLDTNEPEPLKLENQKDNKSKDNIREEKRLRQNLKEAGVDAQSFEDELRDSTNYVNDGYDYGYNNYQVDQNYAATPDSHSEKNTAGNEKAAQISMEEEREEREAKEAKEEVAEFDLLINDVEDVGDIVEKESVVVGVTDDGKTLEESDKNVEDGAKEDVRETVDLGEISFDDDDYTR